MAPENTSQSSQEEARSEHVNAALRAVLIEHFGLLIFIAVVLVILAVYAYLTGRVILSDWAVVSLVAIPAIIIVVAIAAAFRRKLKVAARISKTGGSGNVHLD